LAGPRAIIMGGCSQREHRYLGDEVARSASSVTIGPPAGRGLFCRSATKPTALETRRDGNARWKRAVERLALRAVVWIVVIAV